jgi:hypothetical protein
VQPIVAIKSNLETTPDEGWFIPGTFLGIALSNGNLRFSCQSLGNLFVFSALTASRPRVTRVTDCVTQFSAKEAHNDARDGARMAEEIAKRPLALKSL